MKLGKRADAVGTQELLLVEHLLQDPAEAHRIQERDDAPLGDPEMIWTGGVHRLHDPRHPVQPFVHESERHRDSLPLAFLDHRRGAQREQPHHGAHFETPGAPVRQSQDVVVEAILLVPHALLTRPVHCRRDIVKVLGELHDQILV